MWCQWQCDLRVVQKSGSQISILPHAHCTSSSTARERFARVASSASAVGVLMKRKRFNHPHEGSAHQTVGVGLTELERFALTKARVAMIWHKMKAKSSTPITATTPAAAAGRPP